MIGGSWVLKPPVHEKKTIIDLNCIMNCSKVLSSSNQAPIHHQLSIQYPSLNPSVNHQFTINYPSLNPSVNHQFTINYPSINPSILLSIIGSNIATCIDQAWPWTLPRCGLPAAGSRWGVRWRWRVEPIVACHEWFKMANDGLWSLMIVGIMKHDIDH